MGHNFSELLINVAYDLKNFSFYKSNEKDFETVKKRLINYFKGGI